MEFDFSEFEPKDVVVGNRATSLVAAPDVINFLPDGNGQFVMLLHGWYGGSYARARLAASGPGGKIAWITTLIDGNEGGPGRVVAGLDGEVVATGFLKSNGLLFRAGWDGKVVQKFASRNYHISQIRAHPDGGYLLWLTHMDGDKELADIYVRVKSWDKK